MYEERDMRGVYKYLEKSVGLGGRQSGRQQYVNPSGPTRVFTDHFTDHLFIYFFV